MYDVRNPAIQGSIHLLYGANGIRLGASTIPLGPYGLPYGGALLQENNEFRVLEWIRRIRDDQAALLQGKSNAEIIAFFTEAGEAACRKAESPSKEALTLDSEEEPNE